MQVKSSYAQFARTLLNYSCLLTAKWIQDRSIFLEFFQSKMRVCKIIYMFCKIWECTCEPEIVLFWFLWQKQFHFCTYIRKSYKTHNSTLPCSETFEENIDLSHIQLAVLCWRNGIHWSENLKTQLPP